MMKLCLAMLRKHGSLVGLSPGFSIYSSRDQEDLMTKVARMYEYEDTSKYAILHLVKAANDFREDIVDLKERFAPLPEHG